MKQGQPGGNCSEGWIEDMSQDRTGLSRRRLLGGAAAFGAAALTAAAHPAIAKWLPPTPMQPAGPFYHPFPPLSVDSDLVYHKGKSGPAEGDMIHVMGRVLDPSGIPIAGARVEIWQANVWGRYNHPRHDNANLPDDPNFFGFGHTETDGNGAYRFRSIKPGAYPDNPNWLRPPHIHFAVFPPKSETWTTQMYFAGEVLNDKDFLLQGIKDPKARQRVVVPFKPAGPKFDPKSELGVFDIVIGQPGVERKNI